MRGDFLNFIAMSKNEKMTSAVSLEDTFTIECENGSVITHKDFTVEEMAALGLAFENELAAIESSKKIKRQSILNRLGITEEEANLLLG